MLSQDKSGLFTTDTRSQKSILHTKIFCLLHVTSMSTQSENRILKYKNQNMKRKHLTADATVSNEVKFVC